MFRWEIKDAKLHKFMLLNDTGKHRSEHQGPLQVLSVVDQLTEKLTEHYFIENYPFDIFVSVCFSIVYSKNNDFHCKRYSTEDE